VEVFQLGKTARKFSNYMFR